MGILITQPVAVPNLQADRRRVDPGTRPLIDPGEKSGVAVCYVTEGRCRAEVKLPRESPS
jgi:hypothetical protein